MSLKKQIQRNIEKQNKKEIKQYEPFLKIGWDNMPNKDLNIFANLARNGITLDYLNSEIEKTRKETFSRTMTASLQISYASTVLTLFEEFGFSKDDCFKALSVIDHRISTLIDDEDILREMEEKVGIRFNSKDGVERVEMI